MIKINALFFLLCIELILLLAGAVAFLVFRLRKSGERFRKSVLDLKSARSALDAMKKQSAETKTAPPQPVGDEDAENAPEAPSVTAPAPAADTKELENCKLELSVIKDKLKEKTTLLSDLQVKFDDLEKEYLILYRQQQGQ